MMAGVAAAWWRCGGGVVAVRWRRGVSRLQPHPWQTETDREAAATSGGSAPSTDLETSLTHGVQTSQMKYRDMWEQAKKRRP